MRTSALLLELCWPITCKLSGLRHSRSACLSGPSGAKSWRIDRAPVVAAVSLHSNAPCLAQTAMRDFYGCYLLTSLDPKNKGRTYIGSGVAPHQQHVHLPNAQTQNLMCDCSFTVNPRRRIRQHNGEITAGAHRTKR